MESRYIDGVEIPDYDEDVSKIVDDNPEDDFNFGGHDMVIAVENYQHQVYRVLTVTGLHDLIHTINVLHDIRSFTDLLADNLSTSKEGYDSRFRPL